MFIIVLFLGGFQNKLEVIFRKKSSLKAPHIPCYLSLPHDFYCQGFSLVSPFKSLNERKRPCSLSVKNLSCFFSTRMR